jgi:hypothetical protein
MTSMKDFIPYEQALELKELGFDEPCFRFQNNISNIIEEKSWLNWNEVEQFVSFPFYQQAFRWFREKHNLMFQIFYLRNGNHAAIIHNTTPEYMSLVDQVNPSSGCVGEVVDCYSYEEAELECLIKLIEIVKTK